MDSAEQNYSAQTVEKFTKEAEDIDIIVTSTNMLSKKDESLAETVKNALKRISTALVEAQQVLEMHADGSLPVSNEALLASAKLIAACHNGLGAVIVFITMAGLLK